MNVKSVVLGLILGMCFVMVLGQVSNTDRKVRDTDDWEDYWRRGRFDFFNREKSANSYFVVDTQTGHVWSRAGDTTWDFGTPTEPTYIKGKATTAAMRRGYK